MAFSSQFQVEGVHMRAFVEQISEGRFFFSSASAADKQGREGILEAQFKAANRVLRGLADVFDSGLCSALELKDNQIWMTPKAGFALVDFNRIVMDALSK